MMIASQLYRICNFVKECQLFPQIFVCEANFEFPAIIPDMGSSLFLCFNFNIFSWRSNIFERHIFLIKCRGMTDNVLRDALHDCEIFFWSLNSNCISVSPNIRLANWLNHLGIWLGVCRDWGKSEREKQISYINSYMGKLEKWYRWSYLQSRNRDRHREQMYACWGERQVVG